LQTPAGSTPACGPVQAENRKLRQAAVLCENGRIAAVYENGAFDPAIEEILDLILEYDMVLCTGHIAPAETLALLKRYRGRYVIESFNPLIVRWFRLHAKGVLRGQLVSGMENYMPQFGKCVAWMLASLALNCLSRPDFVAYDVECRFAAPKLQRILFRTPMACWKVSSGELALKRSNYDFLYRIYPGV